MKTKINYLIVLLFCLMMILDVVAQKSASDPKFKVKIDFNRWHDVPELWSDMKRLQETFPKFLKLESIGKSYKGLDIMAMTINNPETGPELSKAAIYIDANIHGNEIQGGEICLYTIWYLMENYERLENIKKLVDERVFYILPSVNPDSRQHFMETDGSNTRTGQVPIDDDNDGLYDEDGPDDLNGNGVIEMMIKYVPREGTHLKNLQNPNILDQVPFGQKGDYIILGMEGIDNDGDGRVNEDGIGGYDPNRDWGSDWQPSYIQGGALSYPFQLPESRAVKDFLYSKPNIAAAQAYHNTGGMIIRGPGSALQGDYPASDIEFYDEIGKMGEFMLPFYRYLVLWSGLYTVHGGFIDWTNDGMGISTFTNELWASIQYFMSPELQNKTKDPNSPIFGQKGSKFFNDYLSFGEHYKEFKDFEHPKFGKIEIGGRMNKFYGRIQPRFMSEELFHRNMAFTLYHAAEMPKMEIGESLVTKLQDNIYRVWVDLTNPKIIPTIMEKSAINNVVRPDLIHLEGKVDIISASWVEAKDTFEYLKPITQSIDQKQLNRIIVRNGHPGKTTRTIQYLVKGSGKIKITYDSLKGGTVSKEINLK